MLRAIVVALAAAAFTVPAAATTTTTAVPTGDAFYAPSVPLPAGRPGAVLRATSIPAPDGARAWRVLVHTRAVNGQDVALSGLVIAPVGAAPKGGRPVVSWAHATTGLADACAPSKGDDAARSVPWVDDLLAAGYVVAATDYQGLGTPGVHPYLVGESEGRSVLDLARAARALPTGANRKVLVLGHSQGGHAALFAGEIAKHYAPELHVLGVAAGAPVTDPEAFLEYTARSPGTVGFLVMGAAGYRVAYPELANAPLLSASVAARADVVSSGCAGDVLATYGSDAASDAFVTDPVQDSAWKLRLQENAAGNRPAGPPVLVWQGAADDLTPASIVGTYVTRACAQGSVVDYRLYPGATHASVLGAAHDDVLAFLAARVRGDRPRTSCPRG